MKKNIINLFLFLSVFVSIISFATPVLADECASLTFDIKYTQRDTVDNGNSITILQKYLNKTGYLQVTPTGYFGNLTLLAVKAFQTANNISSTGYVGPLTRTKIQDLDCNFTNITNDTSSSVTTLPIANKADSVAPNVTLIANPSSVTAGQPTTLTWNSSNAVDKCKLTSKDSDGKSFGSNVDASGKKSSGPINIATTYTVTCYNKYGIPGTKSFSVKILDSANTNTQQTFARAASISSIIPSSANRGDSVKIVGTGFLSTNEIVFDGAKIANSLILSQSSTSISFKIPEYKSCVTGSCLPPKVDTNIETGGQKIVQVSNANGYSNDMTITLPSNIITIAGVPDVIAYQAPKLAVSYISPAIGNRGDTVVVYGTGFSSDSIVMFGGFKVADNLVLYKTNTAITFIIPPFQMGCTEPEYEICPRLPLSGTGLIIETGGVKSVSIMNTSNKATSTSLQFTLPSKKITY